MAAHSTLPSLTVFAPCYNEEKNLPRLIEALVKTADKVARKYEIIIINDGSQDRTSSIAHRYAQKYPFVKVVDHPVNLGYGASLKSGIKAAAYEWIFFTDGDLQFDPRELAAFVPHAGTFDVIIGYRLNRAEGSLRALNARLFKLYIDLLFRLHVRDIDCAFKLIKATALKPLPLMSNGATISAEILYRLKKSHHAFKQLPVHHYPRQFGQPTGNHPRVVIKAGIEALKLYLHMKFGVSYH